MNNYSELIQTMRDYSHAETRENIKFSHWENLGLWNVTTIKITGAHNGRGESLKLLEYVGDSVVTNEHEKYDIFSYISTRRWGKTIDNDDTRLFGWGEDNKRLLGLFYTDSKLNSLMCHISAILVSTFIANKITDKQINDIIKSIDRLQHRNAEILK